MEMGASYPHGSEIGKASAGTEAAFHVAPDPRRELAGALGCPGPERLEGRRYVHDEAVQVSVESLEERSCVDGTR